MAECRKGLRFQARSRGGNLSFSSTSVEILDLRHFSSATLRTALEVESDLWRRRLRWDYQHSIKLLLQYLDSHLLPGYAAIFGDQALGYTFCVYEDTKAVIGDVFAMEGLPEEGAANRSLALEQRLLTNLLELVVNSPQIERVESQMLLHSFGTLEPIFLRYGFEVYRRLFMLLSLEGRWGRPRFELPEDLELRSWRDEELTAASRLISEAYRNHPDSQINDQYRTAHGSLRFLSNVVRYGGCGAFVPTASFVVTERATGALVAVVLGSRVSAGCGHVTQLCVHPGYRRRGLARLLLNLSVQAFVRLGVAEVSLTVTEANRLAIGLYESEGFRCEHSFEAAVWLREQQRR
jgi:ribosomal protein S18 acetylase RimI-like enzyme